MRVEDSGSQSTEQAFAISVNDLGENAPRNMMISANEIEDDELSGANIATITVMDDDINDSSTFTLVAGTGDTDNASFAITGDQIQLAVDADTLGTGTLNVRIRATDLAGLTLEQTFALTVIPADDDPVTPTPTSSKKGGGGCAIDGSQHFTWLALLASLLALCAFMRRSDQAHTS